MPLPMPFIQEVMAEFPGEQWKELRAQLQRGDPGFISETLSSLLAFKMSAEEIIQAFDLGQSNTVLAEAQRALRVQRLYDMLQDFRQIEQLSGALR